MPKIRDIVKIIEDVAPLYNQASYDNSGLFFGDLDWDYKGSLITLDTSVDVVDEAIAKGANLIIEHHPSIFMPIKKIDLKLPKHKAIAKAIKNDIAIYSAHTSIDFAQGGLNDKVISMIGCSSYYPLQDDLQNMRMGELDESITLSKLAERVSTLFKDSHVAYVGNGDRVVSKIAVVNGGGGSQESELIKAMEGGADAFISADFKYNVLRLAKDIDFPVIVFGHYDSEMPFINLIKELLLKEKIENVYGATTCTNPLN